MDLFGFNLNDLLPFIAIGFAAQLIDGALGMAFGVIANSALLFMGKPPAVATSYVHVIKVFTGAASGLSHIIHGNVDWRIFWRIAGFGVIGGVSGAYALSWLHVADSKAATPYVFAYLTLIAVYIFMRGVGSPMPEKKTKIVEAPALIGGFLDSTGGGGWGPVVTSSLLIQGNSPRTTVGTVNASEFVVAVAVSITYLLSLGFDSFPAPVLGLLIGGVAAAPLASFITKHVPARPMMIAVGILLFAISVFGFVKALKFI
jgi:uncharacterized protein